MHQSTQWSAADLLAALKQVHARVNAAVLAACEASSFEQLCGEAKSAAGDVVYAIDRVAEHEMLEAITELIASREPIVLVGEGVEQGAVTLPAGASEAEARWRVIVDPIDGTRGLMFQKRPAWILTAAAPNRGAATRLSNIQIAIQTEIPLVKQNLYDVYWAIKDGAMQGERYDRFNDRRVPFTPRPSTATTLAHGYGTVCSFFASGRDLLGKIADELSSRLLTGHLPGEARIFDDQYASTAGQIAGLIAGHDRFVADVRPLLLKPLSDRGDVLGHCCHPYDICTKLIAEQAGVTVCLPSGQPLDAPLDTHTNITWVGYANNELRARVEPHLQAALRAAGLQLGP